MNNKRKRFAKAQRETALKALDMLALALAEKRHIWTMRERRAYERAVRALA